LQPHQNAVGCETATYATALGPFLLTSERETLPSTMDRWSLRRRLQGQYGHADQRDAETAKGL